MGNMGRVLNKTSSSEMMCFIINTLSELKKSAFSFLFCSVIHSLGKSLAVVTLAGSLEFKNHGYHKA
jgi:hypothetical protein